MEICLLQKNYKHKQTKKHEGKHFFSFFYIGHMSGWNDDKGGGKFC